MAGYRFVFLGTNNQNADINGIDLWITDGTQAGTEELYVAPTSSGGTGVTEGDNDNYQYRFALGPDFAVLNNQLLFVTLDASGDEHLTTSDGTVGGTATLTVPGAPSPWHNVGIPISFDDNQLAAFGAPAGVFSPQLWITNGTGADTQAITVSAAPNGLDPTFLTAFDNDVLFDADPGPSYQVWMSDGTTAGTQQVHITNLSTSWTQQPHGFFVFTPEGQSNQLGLFEGQEQGTGNSELFWTDGTTGNEVMLSGATLDSLPTFRAYDFAPVNGVALWDGASTNTPLLAVTDNAGTLTATALDVSGLTQLAAFGLNGGYATVGGDIYFSGELSNGDFALWQSDGTAGGTEVVACTEVTPNAGEDPHGLAPTEITTVGSQIAFVGTDAQATYQVYLTNGTTLSSISIADSGWNQLAPGGSGPQEPSELEVSGSTLIFQGENAEGTLALFSYNVITQTGTELSVADPLQRIEPGVAFLSGVACYATGTRIMTEAGERPIESLCIGDRLVTRFSGIAPIVWLGHRSIDCLRHPRPGEVWPVRVAAGAFGGGRPHRPLWLSPDHAVLVADVLIPIRCLINGTTIARAPVDAITYWHVELRRHEVILAEGMTCESYLDTDDRAFFANGDAVATLHPSFVARQREASGCAPLVVTGPELQAVADQIDRRRVNRRLG